MSMRLLLPIETNKGKLPPYVFSNPIFRGLKLGLDIYKVKDRFIALFHTFLIETFIKHLCRYGSTKTCYSLIDDKKVVLYLVA